MSVLRPDEDDLRQPVQAVFDAKTGFILVHLDKVSFGYTDLPVRYNNKVFQPKSGLHITIISEDAEKILKHVEKNPEDLDDVEDLVLSTNWSYRKLEDFYYVEKEPGVETIIEMVEVPGLTGFLKGLSKLIGQGFVLPPTHVTLYTLGTEKGIGLPSQTVFDELVKAKINPEDIIPVNSGTSRKGPDLGLRHR